MTEDEREALIERVRAVRDDGYLAATYLGNEHVGDLMRDILDMFEQAHSPTDEEREAARQLLRDVNPQHRPALNSLLAHDIRVVANAVLRRPVQGEPTWDGSVPDDDYGPWGGTEARPQVEPTDAQVVKRVAERAAQAEIQEAVAERDEWRAKAEAPPVYLALDLWMALGLDSREFDGYYDRNGWADTWATLLDAVRRETGSRPPCTQITDGEVCELIAGHPGPHMGASDVGSSEPLPAKTEARTQDIDAALAAREKGQQS